MTDSANKQQALDCLRAAADALDVLAKLYKDDNNVMLQIRNAKDGLAGMRALIEDPSKRIVLTLPPAPPYNDDEILLSNIYDFSISTLHEVYLAIRGIKIRGVAPTEQVQSAAMQDAELELNKYLPKRSDFSATIAEAFAYVEAAMAHLTILERDIRIADQGYPFKTETLADIDQARLALISTKAMLCGSQVNGTTEADTLTLVKEQCINVLTEVKLTQQGIGKHQKDDDLVKVNRDYLASETEQQLNKAVAKPKPVTTPAKPQKLPVSQRFRQWLISVIENRPAPEPRAYHRIKEAPMPNQELSTLSLMMRAIRSTLPSVSRPRFLTKSKATSVNQASSVPTSNHNSRDSGWGTISTPVHQTKQPFVLDSFVARGRNGHCPSSHAAIQPHNVPVRTL